MWQLWKRRHRWRGWERSERERWDEQRGRGRSEAKTHNLLRRIQRLSYNTKKIVSVRFSPFLGLFSYQWLLYFSSRTMTRAPRNSWSWLSLRGLDCCRNRRILITNSTAEFTSTFMLVVWWIQFCWCSWNNLGHSWLTNLFEQKLSWMRNVCTFYSTSPRACSMCSRRFYFFVFSNFFSWPIFFFLDK